MSHGGLTDHDLRVACDQLGSIDPMLGELVERNRYPPLRRTKPGYATLISLIVQQRVSRTSAAAVNGRIKDVCGGEVTPHDVVRVGAEELLAAGMSASKVGYVLGIARDVAEGRFNLEELESLPPDESVARLCELRGVGPWTADVYLLSALGHPDVWPRGDRALLVAMKHALGLPSVPTDAEISSRVGSWAPFRAAAARLVWAEYSVITKT